MVPCFAFPCTWHFRKAGTRECKFFTCLCCLSVWDDPLHYSILSGSSIISVSFLKKKYSYLTPNCRTKSNGANEQAWRTNESFSLMGLKPLNFCLLRDWTGFKCAVWHINIQNSIKEDIYPQQILTSRHSIGNRHTVQTLKIKYSP